MMTTMVVLGDDKICRSVVRDLRLSERSDVFLVKDLCTGPRRTIKVLRSGGLSLSMLFKIATAEFMRRDASDFEAPYFRNSAALDELIGQHRPGKIFLFRANAIIKRRTLGLGVPIMNIHAASLPAFAGLGAIARALAGGACEQCATLHVVTGQVDAGPVLDTEPYRLDPASSYAANEKAAYAAAAVLLERALHISQ